MARAGVAERRAEPVLRALHRGRLVWRALQVDLQMHPAKVVEVPVLHLDDPAVLNRHDACPFGAGFADMAALQIAGEHDPARVTRQFLALVDVAERPVMVAVRDQPRPLARGVVGVRRVALG